MKLTLPRKYVPLLATIAVFVVLYIIAVTRYPGFRRPQMLVNVLRDNAKLGVVAVGMTFVILSGGIDLSVGSIMAAGSVIIAVLVDDCGLNPLLAMAVILAGGAALGFLMGCVIHFYKLPPFIVTLAGMFFARGLGRIIHLEAKQIEHPLFGELSGWFLRLGPVRLYPVLFVFLIVAAAGIYVAARTVFGRNVYAIGGSEEAALLMGIPVGRTKLMVYTLSGLCSALAAVLFTMDSGSGNPTEGVGMELEAIASVVVGGTLLTGGVGYVLGTFFGVLILGTIGQIILNQGTLDPAWTLITTGALLLVFVLLQRLFAGRAATEHT